MLARLDDLHERYDEPVSVVGWSFGGLLARWLAHQRPHVVRQVVCLGSPYRPEGEHTRTTPLFERSARTHGLSERAFEVVDTLRRPLPVPVSAIYSRTDGIVNWRACRLTDAELAPGPATTSRSRAATWTAVEPALARRARRPAGPGPGRLATLRLEHLPAAHDSRTAASRGPGGPHP